MIAATTMYSYFPFGSSWPPMRVGRVVNTGGTVCAPPGPSAAMVLAASIGYAFAVIYITRKMPDGSGIAINGIAMVMTAVFYSPALFFWPDHSISNEAIYSLIALGVLSTGIAFAVFFTVMAEIGPTRASLVTYMNTAFAVVLGVIILNEPLTVGIIVGLPLVLIGSFLASRRTSA